MQNIRKTLFFGTFLKTFIVNLSYKINWWLDNGTEQQAEVGQRGEWCLRGEHVALTLTSRIPYIKSVTVRTRVVVSVCSFFFKAGPFGIFAHEVGEQNKIWNVSAKNTLTMETFLAKTFQIPFCSSLIAADDEVVHVHVCVCFCSSVCQWHWAAALMYLRDPGQKSITCYVIKDFKK